MAPPFISRCLNCPRRRVSKELAAKSVLRFSGNFIPDFTYRKKRQLPFYLTSNPWNFRRIYKSRPKSSNIIGRIYISIMLKPTMPTLKNFSVAIRLSLNWVDVMAARTCLTSISRWHKYHWHTSNIRLVPNKQTC